MDAIAQRTELGAHVMLMRHIQPLWLVFYLD